MFFVGGNLFAQHYKDSQLSEAIPISGWLFCFTIPVSGW